MRSHFYLLILAFLLGNTSLKAQTKAEWIPLFNGSTLNGWRQAQKDTFPDAGWSAQNGELSFDPAKDHGTDIITTRSFTNFELIVDFKVSVGGNSGIKYFLIPNTSLGCEFQLIDDSTHPDARLGINGNRKTGALYDILPASAAKPYKGAGVWNTARIVIKGNHVEHWLNGYKVVEYVRGSLIYQALVARSKYAHWVDFGMAEKGRILLQDHGDNVSFRSIKIKELK